jgi:tRNA A37 threonylcarbamoyladenosine dehydratase
MVQDCIDVIEDLNKQIEIMKIELNDRNFVIDHMFVNMNEDPTAIFAAEMLKIQTENEAEKHNALLEKMRAELRGDICE